MSYTAYGRRWLSSLGPGVWPGRVVAAFAAALILFVASLGFYNLFYLGRVLPGTGTMGQDLGGMTREQTAAAVRARFAAYEQAGLQLSAGSATWVRTPKQLGLRLDARATTEQALAAGRSDNPVASFLFPLSAWGEKTDLAPVISVNRSELDGALQAMAADVDRPAVDAHLVIKPDGDVEVSASQSGQVLDIAGARQALETHLLAIDADPLSLPLRSEPPRIVEAQLEAGLGSAKQALSGPLTLRFGDQAWELSTVQLAGMLVPTVSGTGDSASVTLTLDPARVEGFLAPIAAEIDEPASDASLTFADGALTLTPHKEGRRADVSTTTDLLSTSLFQSSRSIDVKVDALPATVTEADLLPVKAQAETVIGSPVALTFEERTWNIEPATLAQSLTLEVDSAAEKGLPKLHLDEAAFTAFVEGIVPEVNRDPRNARFQFAGDYVSVAEESLDGVSVDVGATVQAVKKAALSSERKVPLVVHLTPAEVQSAQASEIVITDVLASNSSNYAGGSAERRHNVVLATSKLDGTLIAPGEVFSFNAAVGPTTTANGYQDGYAIVTVDGKPRTVPSVAGGICQVATSLFQAAFYAGLPIEERHPHFYWIPRYGATALGMRGLDSTVDEAYGVDFRFRNTTGNWLAIRTGADDSTLYFTIRGVDPGWTVEVSDPIISDVVPADPKPVEDVDLSFPPGKRIQVETAQDGFRSLIARRVYKGEDLIDETTIASNYVPARNAFLVGPKPEGAPLCTPGPDGTPVADPACVTPTPGTPGPEGTPSVAPADGTPAPPAEGTPAPALEGTPVPPPVETATAPAEAPAPDATAPADTAEPAATVPPEATPAASP